MTQAETATASKLVRATARASFGLGVLLLLFAAFQLWGTAFSEGQSQQQLAEDFASLTESTIPQEPAQNETEAEVESEEFSIEQEPRKTRGVAPAIPGDRVPESGSPLGVLKIPAIGVDKVIIQGVGIDELRQGPGHYKDSALPGQAGNAAIAGHRTTYGAPFGELDLLEPGDRIEVETLQGTFHYEVLPQASSGDRDIGHFIVAPSDTYVIHDYGDNRLTLTACHPKYTAQQRIVVQAELIDSDSRFVTYAPALDADTDTTTETQSKSEGIEPTLLVDEAEVASTVSDNPNALADSLGWNRDEIPAVLVWAALFVTVLILANRISRRLGNWPIYLFSLPLAGVALWSCFVHLDRLLPAY
jgi:sortase A